MTRRPGTMIRLGDGIDMDLDVLMTSKLLVQANSGGGKSWAVRRILEQTHKHVQQIVLDPEGEFSSLREKFDYVYVAANGGDTVADPRTAKLLAIRLLELGASAIIDLYELKPKERIRFIRLFLETMVDAPKALWHPVLVVVDEAHESCPQNGEAESADAVIDMCSRGRKRGFCVVLATQRISELNKSAAADLNNKLIGRASLDVDMKRSAEELQFTTKEQKVQLRQLEPGEFYTFGPAISPSVRKVTMGAVQTSHPEAGSGMAFSAPPPTAKIKALLPKLADLPAEAAHEAKTVADLQRVVAEKNTRIRELERAQPKTEVKIKEVRVDRHVPMVPEAELAAVEEAVKAASVAVAALRRSAKSLKGSNGGVLVSPQIVKELRQRPSSAAPARAVLPRTDVESVTSLPKAERLILNVLAQYPDGRSIVQVAIMAGYAHGGGGFRNAIGALRSKGLVEGTGDRMTITDEGHAVVGNVDPLPVGGALLRHWTARSGKAERLILEALAEVAPQTLTVEEIAAAAGYEAGGGGFRNALGKLRTLELIKGRGDVQLAEELQGA